MIDPPKHAANYGDRVRARDEKAREFLEGRTGLARTWSRFHLWLGDTADGMYAFTHNEYLAGGIGALIGMMRGIVVGIIPVCLIAIFAPVLITTPLALFMGPPALALTTPALIQAGTLISAGLFALNDGWMFYREAEKDAVAEKAGELGDKIAKQGKALAHEPIPVKMKAIERLKAEGDIDLHHAATPPEKGENHRYALAKRRAAELANNGKSL